MGVRPEKGFYCTHCSNFLIFVSHEAIQIGLRPKELSVQVGESKIPWVQLGRNGERSSTEDLASLQSLFLRLDSLLGAGKTCRLLLEDACMAGSCAFLVMPTVSQGPPLPQALSLQEKFYYSVAVQRLSQALVLLVFFSPDKSAHILDFHSNISEWLSRNSTAVYNIRKINPNAI